MRIVVENKAIMILLGTEMDYVEDDIKAEFVFRNPNEKVENFILNLFRDHAGAEKASTYEHINN